MQPDLLGEVSGDDRGEPLVTGSHRHANGPDSGVRGSLAVVQGRSCPRPRRTVGGEKAGRPEPYKRGYGGREPPVPPARCRWVMSHYDAHLCRLVRSPASAMTSVDRWARLLQGLGVSPSHHSPVRLVHKSVHTDFR